MSDIKTRASVADELRQAAEKLRATGSQAMAGPWESLDNGDRLVAWRNVPGTDFDDDFEYVLDEPLEKETAEWIALVSPALAEPLAAWLEEAARQYEAPPCDDPTGVCNGCERRDDFVLAEAVARALNGTVA